MITGRERRAGVCIGCLMMAFGAPAPLQAQTPGRVELGGFVEWMSGSTLGDRAATLTRNPADGTAPFELFTTSGRQDGTLGGGVTIGARVTERFSVEGRAALGRPKITLTIANDVEHQGAVTAAGRLSEYLFEGSLLVDLAPRMRWRPFAMGGAGYLRQLHDERAIVETGRVNHAGAGVKHQLLSKPTGRVTGAGLRLHGRVLVRDGGFTLARDRRVSFNVGAGLFVQF